MSETKTISTRIKLRNANADAWLTSDLSLLQGEFAYDSTNRIIKIGTGDKKWSELDSIKVLSSNIDGLADGIAYEVAGAFVDLSTAAIKPAIEAAMTAVIGESSDTAESATVYGAKKYADSLSDNYDVKGAAQIVRNYVGTFTQIAQETTVVGYIDAKVASISKGMNFRGVVSALTAVTEPSNGDIAILSGTTKEYVYSTEKVSAGADGWVLLGDESAYDTVGSAAAVLGTTEDLSSANTVFGAKKATSALIETLGDLAYKSTVTSADIQDASITAEKFAADLIFDCGNSDIV